MSSHSIEELLQTMNPKLTAEAESDLSEECADSIPGHAGTDEQTIYADASLQKYLVRLELAKFLSCIIMGVAVELIILLCPVVILLLLYARIGVWPSALFSLASMILVALPVFRNHLHIRLYNGILQLLRPKVAPQCPECEAAWMADSVYQCSSCEQSQASSYSEHWSGSCKQCGSSPDAVVCWRCGSATRLGTGSRLGVICILHKPDEMSH